MDSKNNVPKSCEDLGGTDIQSQGLVCPSDFAHLRFKKWLTTEELAYYLGSSAGSIRNLAWRGQIPFHKKFRRLFFNREEIDGLIESGRVFK